MKWWRERIMKFHAPFSYFSHGKLVCCCCGVCRSLILLARRYWRRWIREHGWGFHSLIFVIFKQISCIYILKCKVKTQWTCNVVTGFPLFEIFEMCLRCPSSWTFEMSEWMTETFPTKTLNYDVQGWNWYWLNWWKLRNESDETFPTKTLY